jgi:hypothetical protein
MPDDPVSPSEPDNIHPTLRVGATPLSESPTHPVPASTGIYRAPRLLGEGGMSAVSEAEQNQPRLGAARKVIKAASANRQRGYNQAHQRCRGDNTLLNRRLCNCTLKQPKIEDLP